MNYKFCIHVMAGGVLLLAIGCQTPEGRTDRTATGALTGAALGAGTGAIIGSATGRAGEGAAIGAALGALTGGIIGHSIDQAQRETLAQQSPQTLQRLDQGRPLALADIKALSRAGVSDDIIKSQIRNTRSVYYLGTAEILELKEAGVSEKVIDFMINTPSMYGHSAPPPPPPPPPRRYYY
jgi:outer membrane lipoprotein SlyB